jgi:hypothetical protein
MAQQQPSFGQRLGLMYKRWVLDCIPNLGHAVSVDFSNRPELYKQVNAKTAQQLTELQSEYGYAPNVPTSIKPRHDKMKLLWHDAGVQPIASPEELHDDEHTTGRRSDANHLDNRCRSSRAGQ